MDIKKAISDSILLKQKLLQNSHVLIAIEQAAEQMTKTFQHQGKVLLCGNGGSAADAQHIAAELSGKFYFNRKPLFAEALHVNSSYITAVANDYSYNDIYSRMTEAAGRKGDVLIGISTSGNSENILRAMEVANSIGMMTVALTGEKGGKLRELAQILINVPGNDTPRIQEAHSLVGHILCHYV